ncbi:MAG: ExeM/NucH family extracellular endonuclease [Gaiellaceae bacterium]
MRAGRLAALGALCAFVLLIGGVTPIGAAPSPNLVISQVYGGGGNSGAPFTHDYVEIFNRGATAVSLGGYSVQYASATGTGNFASNPVTALSGTLAPGQYYLVRQSGGTTGASLPTPDAIGSVNMSATGGKVVLANTTSGLACNGSVGQPCSAADLAQIVDLVGYGTANFFEGTATPALSNTTAALRNTNGCVDTDNNAADFTVGAPAPRNTATPFATCPTARTLSITDVSAPEGNAGTSNFTFTVNLSAPAGASGVSFDLASADGTATTAGIDYIGGAQTGATIPEGGTSFTYFVQVHGDTVLEPDEHFFVNVTNVAGAVVGDFQGTGTILNDDVLCGSSYTPIYQIQGSGPNASITGNVTTEGIVVGDFEGSTGMQGFYLQDAAGDGNSATSDGIFVFTGSSNLVSPGQQVRVTGFARERNGQTALNGTNSNSSPVPAANVAACGTGSVAPTDVTMPFASMTAPEQYEGMLVRFPQSLVIAEYFNYERFGEMVLALPLPGESRPFSPTLLEEPGAPAQDRLLANQLRRITLDDGLGIQNPVLVRHPDGGFFSLANRFRGSDQVDNALGVLGFDFGLYRIQPTGPAGYTATNPRPAAPSSVGGRLKVAAFNTLNYFLTLDYPTGDPLDNKCGPLQNVECRGADADQPTEFTRQRDKLLAALAGLDGDVVGLNELENTSGVDPQADIVAGLNAMLGPGTYSYVNTGVIGPDTIKVGLIYKPASVTPVGSWEILTSADDPRFIEARSRPALAQTFEEVATGARFTVIVNHLKSKGSACDGADGHFVDPDTGDGQGNCNQTRTQATQALVDWAASDPTGSGDPDFLITGDLNAYAMEDPIDAVKAGPDDTAGSADDYTNLVAQFMGAFAHSFVFDGMAGYLDHALSNATLTPQVTGVTEWHINADEPDLLDYDTSFKPAEQEAVYEPNAFRSSDHDPVLIGLALHTSFADLCRLTREYSSNEKVAEKLCDRLEKAERAGERGKPKKEQHELDKYVKEVERNKKGAFTDEEAATLISLAEVL